MKIAVIVRSLKFGGMERAACNQADAFFQSGHDVDLIYFSNKNKEIKPREKNVNLIHMDINNIMRKNIFGLFWNMVSKFINLFFRKMYPFFKGLYLGKIFIRELKKLEKDKKYDLILIRGQGTFEQIWTFKDSRCVKITVNVPSEEKYKLTNKIISKYYFTDNHVNCNSEGGAEYFKKKFKKENIFPKSLKAIRNPFFTEEIINLSNEENLEIPNEPYIIGVGRFVKTKNFDLLLDMYIYLKENYQFPYKLVLIGNGSERDFLQKKVLENKLEEDVLFTGYQKNPYNWMKNSEAFVLTSKNEGLCGVLIEAMCCKTRIVATKSPGGVTELMSGEKTINYLVEPNAKILADTLVKSLEKEKEYFFSDYENIMSTLKPSYVVEKWLEYTNGKY